MADIVKDAIAQLERQANSIDQALAALRDLDTPTPNLLKPPGSLF